MKKAVLNFFQGQLFCAFLSSINKESTGKNFCHQQSYEKFQKTIYSVMIL